MYVNIKSSAARHEEEDSICEGKLLDKDPCGLHSNCINRALLLECNLKTFPAGEIHQNQSLLRDAALEGRRKPIRGAVCPQSLRRLKAHLNYNFEDFDDQKICHCGADKCSRLIVSQGTENWIEEATTVLRDLQVQIATWVTCSSAQTPTVTHASGKVPCGSIVARILPCQGLTIKRSRRNETMLLKRAEGGDGRTAVEAEFGGCRIASGNVSEDRRRTVQLQQHVRLEQVLGVVNFAVGNHRARRIHSFCKWNTMSS
ncbi:hypothetical protein pipiens_014117 [Culex pipiens pipiens]|uniref:AWS domain-containing protein n=1 Tax=Culex pipiens pipiens TaxID=38569 RepID=A0ABD1CVS5_CULPP